jgi:hypothetical protein
MSMKNLNDTSWDRTSDLNHVPPWSPNRIIIEETYSGVRRSSYLFPFYERSANTTQVTVAARSKARVCGRSPAEVVDSNPTGGMSVVSIV